MHKDATLGLFSCLTRFLRLPSDKAKAETALAGRNQASSDIRKFTRAQPTHCPKPDSRGKLSRIKYVLM